MILETSRLVLRPMTMADAPALFAILGDAEAMEFWGRPPLPRLATVEAQMADELAAMQALGTVSTGARLQGMARRTDAASDAVPVELKAVDARWPLYGQFRLEGGRRAQGLQLQAERQLSDERKPDEQRPGGEPPAHRCRHPRCDLLRPLLDPSPLPAPS